MRTSKVESVYGEYLPVVLGVNPGKEGDAAGCEDYQVHQYLWRLQCCMPQ